VDRVLITLALRQVLDNALKYSEPFSAISCRVEVRDADLILRVEDRGPGVPDRDRQRIFDKFYRRADTRDRVPGTGLGLRVESASPQDAAFCFYLPGRESAGHEHGPRPRGG
jgi:signal transduction histidine kinase